MVELNLSEPCPCGSGKPGGECCWRGGLAFVVPEANPRPPAPKTGFAHPECYARSLNDCSDDISKEHYVSRNILESFAPSGRFDVVNPPWALGKTVPVSPGTFFARVLCRRHNNALIDLDTTGGNFFRAVMAAPTPRPRRRLSTASTWKGGSSSCSAACPRGSPPTAPCRAQDRGLRRTCGRGFFSASSRSRPRAASTSTERSVGNS